MENNDDKFNQPNQPNQPNQLNQPNQPNQQNQQNQPNHKKRFEDELNDELDEYFREFVPKKRIKLSKNKKYTHCNNKFCDHKNYTGFNKINWQKTNKINVEFVDSIKDLIDLANCYHCRMRKYFNGIDLELLFAIKEDLEELNKMIGLANIKEEVVNLIIHLLLLMNNNKVSETTNMIDTSSKISSDMLHCVITGSPGCGKTTFIEIYAKILTKLGVSKSGHIVKVKRSDLIGKYLGHTAVQTQKKIDEAKGGILLIDEAYSLGNPEQRDSFSKECLDTLNQALSENKQDFICIIAGYANALDNSFFSYNEGLRRRFPFRFDIQPYTSRELTLILEKKIKEFDYYTIKFELKELGNIIKKNFKHFKNQGGDMETLFLNIKINHNKRIFLLPVEEKSNLYIYDIEIAVEKFIKLKGKSTKI
jgi:energy-coupling factor transporter ATP-binding protein EcfA2